MRPLRPVVAGSSNQQIVDQTHAGINGKQRESAGSNDTTVRNYLHGLAMLSETRHTGGADRRITHETRTGSHGEPREATRRHEEPREATVKRD